MKINKNNKASCSRVENKFSFYYILPIALIVCIVPLIAYLKVVSLENVSFTYWTGQKISYDFFSYYKMVFLIFLTSISMIMLFLGLYKEKFKLKKTYYYIPLVIYSIFVILSTLFSQHKDVSVLGFVDRYEGMLALIAYMLIVFLLINILTSDTEINIIVITLTLSALIIGIIGVFQYLNLDIFKTNFGKFMMLPQKYHSLASSINFPFGDRVIYSTLYHYNYVGSYMAMLFPFFSVLCYFEKKKNYKLVYGLTSIIMFVNWTLCKSRAGIVGGVFAAIVGIIMLRKKIFKKWKIIVPTFLGVVLIISLLNRFSIQGFKDKLVAFYEGQNKKQDVEILKDININKDSIKVITSRQSLDITFKNSQLTFSDGNGASLATTYSDGKGIINDDRYKSYLYSLTPGNNFILLKLSVINKIIDFAITSEGFKIVDYKGEAVDLIPIEKFGFEGLETLGSARGYIWSRSIPLLKHTFFIGYGPDTFALHFPQNDYIGKIIAYGTPAIIVDKPHNLFLQTAINTGVISLIALMLIFVLYFIQSYKIYHNCKFSIRKEIIGLATFLAFCGYIGAAIFNDSVISVSPVFWVLLGIGISINLKLIKVKQDSSSKIS